MRAASDKRRHPRFEGAGLDAGVKIDGRPVRNVDVENVSLGGALLGFSARCSAGKNVLIELTRSQGRTVKLVGRVVAAVTAGHGRRRAGARVRFNPLSARCTAELYALIRAQPIEAVATEAAAPEFHTIDLEDDEPEIALVDVVDDGPTQLFDARDLRIAELERQLDEVRRRARTLEDVLLPSTIAS